MKIERIMVKCVGLSKLDSFEKINADIIAEIDRKYISSMTIYRVGFVVLVSISFMPNVVIPQDYMIVKFKNVRFIPTYFVVCGVSSNMSRCFLHEDNIQFVNATLPIQSTIVYGQVISFIDSIN